MKPISSDGYCYKGYNRHKGRSLSYCQQSIYYKYAPDGTRIFVLSYVDDCVYWYTSEALRRWFVDALRKIFHVKLLGMHIGSCQIEFLI